jgi:trimeric autotransporter adhesin
MIRSARTVAALCATLFLLGIAACGDDDEGGTGLPAAITITLGSSTLTLVQGNAGTVGVTVGRQNGASGAIAVAVEGLPTGVTAPAISIADGQTTGTLNFTVAPTAAAATTALTVRATAAGVTAVTAPLSLVVQAAPVQGFSMSLNPTTVSIPSGNNTGTSNLTITRTGGFAGSIALTATGAPSGMTVTFNPASTTGTTSVVSVAITNAVAAGNYTVTLRGNATGLAEQTATLTVTVTAASGVTMALSPTTVPVQAGSSGTSTLTLTRVGGFAAAVTLSATAASTPAGVTVSFNPVSLTGSTLTSTVTVATTASVAAGSYPITLRGDATGLTSPAEAVLTLTVTAAPAGGFTVSLSPTTQTLQQGQSANIAVPVPARSPDRSRSLRPGCPTASPRRSTHRA